ncbi:ribonucleases P/MRP protein subunit POP1-domain-containing protein [Crassisporium funariophilum]|nr:ribonucleases P/MRP protein subunit POP1-domain-containing protein [Crassisporium funariophilum]
MAQKRKNGEGAEEMTGREKKKMKMSAARTIAVQTTPQVGPSRKGSLSAMAGNSKGCLPNAIDVEKFIEARAFEIDAMHKTMKTTSAGSTHRAWQTLPRHLRRRAASHDVRRVPLRLREKARSEMDPVRKRALGRAMPKRGKDKRVTRTESFRKRQRDKTWLETHIWHAKRMHMENLWGYRLAIRPTEKAYRPSHRASVHGSILHDASYYSVLEIKGHERTLIAMLELCCDPQGPGPGSKRSLGGSRTHETHFYKTNSYPFDLIGPVTIIWQPLNTHRPSEQSSAASSKGKAASTKHDKGKEKEQTLLPSQKESTSMGSRTVWLRFHPSMHDDVFNTLTEVASLTLAKLGAPHRQDQEANVEIADLKGHVNIFEIIGPKSSQVIKGAVSPVPSEGRDDFLKFWSSLTNLQCAGSIPRGMVIGFTVQDPRLNFPPKNAKPQPGNSSHVPSTNVTFPSSHLAISDIWDEDIRNGLSKPRFKKKDIDERRSRNEIPGTPLNALRQDNRIPILMIQRSIGTHGSDSTQALHGWTLIVPAGWSMAFFNSLVFTNTRVGGQRECQTQAYEAGAVYFPRDYPFTAAYDTHARDKESSDKRDWDRKPPAKRVNYVKLGTRSPWRADWEVVLGIAKDIRQRDEGDSPAFVTTQRDVEAGFEQSAHDVRPWLLRGSEVPRILASVSSVFNHGATLLSEIDRLRTKRGQDALGSGIKAANLMKGALINVKVTMCSRGAPQDLAIIHSLSDDASRKWERALQRRKLGEIALDHDDTSEETELAETVPPSDSIIGYVTTGHFSLARGAGFGIGAIPVTHLLELEQRTLRLHPNQKLNSKAPPMLVTVRNRDGHQWRAAHLEVLLDA